MSRIPSRVSSRRTERIVSVNLQRRPFLRQSFRWRSRSLVTLLFHLVPLFFFFATVWRWNKRSYYVKKPRGTICLLSARSLARNMRLVASKNMKFFSVIWYTRIYDIDRITTHVYSLSLSRSFFFAGEISWFLFCSPIIRVFHLTSIKNLRWKLCYV